MRIIKQNQEARESLRVGVNKLSDIIRKTLGPAGKNVILGNHNPVITNDGISIAKQIVLEDEIENQGAQTIVDICTRTNEKAGDGTTTSTVLAQQIINDGFERLGGKMSLLSGGTNVMDLKREIMSECGKVVEELKKMAKPVKSKSDVVKVATISAESKEIGELVGEAIWQIGKDGAVNVEDDQHSTEITTQIVEGLQLPRGFYTPYMSNNERGEAVLQNPHILVHGGKILDLAGIQSICTILGQRQGVRELLVLTNNIDPTFIPTFVYNKQKGIFNVVVVKTVNTEKQEMEEIALMLNAKLIDQDKGMELKDVQYEDLGKCDKAVVTIDRTKLIGTKADKEAITKRVEYLKTAISEEKDTYMLNQYKRRISQLAGGVAVIRVGARTETERNYLKLKIEDTVNASRAAMEEGVVKGGGIALKEISEKLPESILTNALKAPYLQIQENAGGSIEIGKDVIDPVKVTRNALENACSAASLLLTTEVAIAEKEPDLVDELRGVLMEMIKDKRIHDDAKRKMD